MSETCYEVTIVRYGTRRTTRSDVYLNYSLYGEPDGPIGMDYFFWLVRNDEHTIVVDTGFSKAGGEHRSRTTLISPPEAFEALGVDPSDEPTVVLTHAHYDHIGNLDHFPRSQLVIARAELEFWQTPTSRQVQFHHSVEDADLAELTDALQDGRVRTFDDTVQLADGVDVIRVGGHTPGQSLVRVRTTNGPVLLASDALHYYEEGEKGMPFVSVANLVDMYAGFDTIDEMVSADARTSLVSGHDPSTLERFGNTGGVLGGAMTVIGAAS